MDDETIFDVIIDAEESLDKEVNARHILNPVYQSMRGSLDERIESLSTSNNHIDGRWMLAAQHLESWRSLWTPHISDNLPTLEELMTWLVAVEMKLDEI